MSCYPSHPRMFIRIINSSIALPSVSPTMQSIPPFPFHDPSIAKNIFHRVEQGEGADADGYGFGSDYVSQTKSQLSVVVLSVAFERNLGWEMMCRIPFSFSIITSSLIPISFSHTNFSFSPGLICHVLCFRVVQSGFFLGPIMSTCSSYTCCYKLRTWNPMFGLTENGETIGPVAFSIEFSQWLELELCFVHLKPNWIIGLLTITR